MQRTEWRLSASCGPFAAELATPAGALLASVNIMTVPSRPTSVEPPLELPYYRAPIIPALRRFFVKYATFSGRAGRAEYWWSALLLFAFPLIVQLANGLATGDWRAPDGSTFTTAPDAIVLLFSLATLIPSLAIGWRRMHDIDKSGLWVLFGFIPIVGWVVFLIFSLMPAIPEGQRFDRYR